MRMLRRSAALMLAAVSVTAGLSRADSLEFASDQAAVVVKVNDLASTSQKIGRYARELGATMVAPNMADPLASFTEELGIKGGLNEKGDAAIVVFAPSDDVPEGDNVVILLPVSDYAALVASWEKTGEDGAITEVKTPNGGETGYVTQWGDYAALAKVKSLIAAKPEKAITVPAKSAEALKSQDMVMFANIEAVAPLVKPEVDKGRAEALEDVGGKDVPEQYKPVVTAGVNRLFDVADAFFRDADGAVVGITLGENGINTLVLADFKADSYIGGFVGKISQTDKPLLVGLPETGYLFTVGWLNSEALSNAIFADIIDPLVAELPAEEKLSFIKGYVEEAKKMTESMDSFSYGIHTPTGMLGQDPMIQASIVMQGDGNAMKASMAKLNEYGQQATELMMAAAGGESGVQIASKTTPGAKEVGGVSFDEVDVSIVGDGPQANQQRQAFKMMYGSESQKTYVGATDKAALIYMGLSDDQVAALVTTAKAGDAPLAALSQVQSVTKALPGERAAEVYVHLDQFAAVGLRFAQTFGAVRNPPQIPAGLEPLGFSLGGETGTVRIDGYLPLNTLKAMVSVGLQTYGSMQGGGGGGGGGL